MPRGHIDSAAANTPPRGRAGWAPAQLGYAGLASLHSAKEIFCYDLGVEREEKERKKTVGQRQLGGEERG